MFSLLRIVRLVLALMWCDWFRQRSWRRLRRPLPRSEPWSAGVSVVVPARGGVELLASSLPKALEALSRAGEPGELVVVVNGSDPGDYEELERRMPDVVWLFHAEPMSFAAAVRLGLERARFDWVYLLNSDMEVEPDSLVELLRWRGERVFAVASQVFFTDRTRRREETGWTDFDVQSARLELFDAEPETDATVRGHLYAGGGASLFRRSVLLRLWAEEDPYAPFYWEDVEWGIRAWREGYEVLFCPASRAWHRHRATIGRYYSAAEIERVFGRNAIRFALRNPVPKLGPLRLALALGHLPAASRCELLGRRLVRDSLAARAWAWRAPHAQAPVRWLRRKYYLQPAADETRPLVVVATPYVLYPPAHGGAVRLQRLLRELAAEFRIVLLSDEQDAYGSDSTPWFAPLAAVHLVGGRKERCWQRDRRIGRIVSHSHSEMRSELQRLRAVHRPALVDVEFAELAALAAVADGSEPWVLGLHDVTLSGRSRPDRADRYELRWIRRFDAVVTCSEEDTELLSAALGADARRPAVCAVPNGVDTGNAYRSSVTSGPRLLFLGSFRYPPNLHGICEFLESVLPRLRAQVPDVELVVLGGVEASATARGHECFAQSGVRVVDMVQDVRPFLDSAAVSINPLRGIRGSSVKVIESVAAGRVCVSTEEGARGFRSAGFDGLVTVPRIEDFTAPLVRLLTDVEHRLELEQPRTERLEPFTWARAGAVLAACWQRLIDDHGGAP